MSDKMEFRKEKNLVRRNSHDRTLKNEEKLSNSLIMKALQKVYYFVLQNNWTFVIQIQMTLVILVDPNKIGNLHN